MDDFTIDTEAYIGVGRTVFLANPNAPTGVALSLREIERIVAGNPDNVVVVDEAYVDFGAESAVSLIGKYDNLLVIQTFSKSRSLAGARLGFALGNRELIGDLNTIKYSTNPYNVSRMTENAGVGALLDDGYMKANCAEIMRVRAYTVEAMKRMGFVLTDSKANFLFARHPKIGGRDFYLRLKERGVLIRHFDKERLTDYNRITIGSAEQMDIFLREAGNILEEQKFETRK